MPIPISMDATWLNTGASYNAAELRRADAAMFNGDASAFGVRGGIVRHGDLSLDVTVNSSDVVTIQPGAVVIPGNSGVGNGCYRCALDAATSGTLSARNATNPRITLVVFRALDTDVVAGHGAYTGRIEFVDGTPAASPVAPALPVMAVELARITVPATAGGTATVDKTNRTYSTTAGGRLAVPTVSKLPASDAKYDQAVALDTGVEYEWNGTAWVDNRLPYFHGAMANAITNVSAAADFPFVTVEDTHGGWSGTQYAVQKAGVYRVYGSIKANASGPGSGNSIYLMKNGSLFAYPGTVTANVAFGTMSFQFTTRCVVGDTLKVQCQQAFVRIIDTVENCFFIAEYVRP